MITGSKAAARTNRHAARSSWQLRNRTGRLRVQTGGCAFKLAAGAFELADRAFELALGVSTWRFELERCAFWTASVLFLHYMWKRTLFDIF